VLAVIFSLMPIDPEGAIQAICEVWKDAFQQSDQKPAE